MHDIHEIEAAQADWLTEWREHGDQPEPTADEQQALMEAQSIEQCIAFLTERGFRVTA